MKYIKLTRFDNRPVWLNASFVVTVEPRRDGVGSVVVPIGDGLDYDVRESPEAVLKLLADEAVPAVVPVPVSDGLAPTPKDVSPEPEPRRGEPPALPADGEPAKSEEPKRPRRRTARAKADGDASSKRIRKASEPKKEPPKEKEEPLKEEPKEAPAVVAPMELSDDQVARLAKLSPKTVDKLKNTLLTQFHIADVIATIQGLEAKGAFTRDGKRVIWTRDDSAKEI